MDTQRNPSTEISKVLWQQVRAAYVARGTSLTAWCNSVGLDRRNAHRAVMGGRNGPVTRALRDRVLKAAGVHHE